MWKKALFFSAILICASSGLPAVAGEAEPYPSRPIKIIEGFGTTGSADFMARVIGPKLTERLGQPVTVENRLGAGSNLAAEVAARASPDGYTMMMAVTSTLASSRSLFPKLGYDLLKDFSYISLVATGAQVLVVHPSMPDSVSALVALVRSKPGAIRYGSAGAATTGHLAMELLISRTGMEIQHIPYKGATPVSVAVTSGEIQMAIGSPSGVIPLIQDKRMKAVAVTSEKRVGLLPGIPTVAESGIPGYSFTNTLGLIAPVGMPAAAIRTMNAEIRRIVQMDDIRAKAAPQGLELAASTPEEFRSMTEAAVAQISRIIKDANITLDQ